MSVASNTRSSKHNKFIAPNMQNNEEQPETSTPNIINATNDDVPSTTNLSNKESKVKALKSLRFKRNIAIKMIKRYDEATKKKMADRGSRTAMRRNMRDMLSHLDEVEHIHDQIQEVIGEDEEVIEDTMILADLRIEVNNIVGLIEEHIEERLQEPPTRCNSEAGSQYDTHNPVVIINQNSPPSETTGSDHSNEDKVPGAAHDNKAEADLTPPSDEEVSGAEKAALYVQHLGSMVNEATVNEKSTEDEDWIVEFHHTKSISVRAVDPGKLPVKADVPIYNGDPLKWLSWSGLFKALVHDTRMSSEAKMGYLHTKLSRECDLVIAGLYPDDDGYAEALMLLRDRYGHPTALQAAHLEVLKTVPPISTSNEDSLPLNFQSFVDKVRSHLAVLNRYSKGESPFVSSLIYELTAKLPQEDAKAWRTKVGEGQEKMTLSAFSAWLGARGRSYWGALPPQLKSGSNPRGRQRQRRSLFTQQGPPKCAMCEGKHKIAKCTEFKELSPQDRFDIVKEKRLCFNCLDESHISRSCPQKKVCGKDGCTKKHDELLHLEKKGNSAMTKTQRPGVALGMIKVSVIGAGGRHVQGNLLFDDGSDTTLVSDSFAKRAGLRGKKMVLNITGVGGKENRSSSSQVTLKVETPDGDADSVKITAWTLSKLCQPVNTIPWPSIKDKWQHLKDLDLKEIGGEVDILLGLDHAHLLVPLEVKVGEPREPVAKKTPFGWMAVGPIGTSQKSARAYHLTGNVKTLDAAFQRFWDSESFGTKLTESPTYTKEEERALNTLREGIKKLERGYEVPLLWKEDEPNLDNNRHVAEKRLRGLQRRFERDPKFAKDYREAISKYVENGYAHKVDAEEDLHSSNQWYLPHHGVYKRSDPTQRKIRVVFDASAKFNDKSLNDALLPGPVLQNELPQVLTKFRERDIGFSADIEAMFSRVRVHEKDARYHRFLWNEAGSQVIDTYQMDRLTFGDTCSPFEAIYVTQQVAKDFGNGREDSVTAIKENLYVDGYLDSAETDEQATMRGREVSDILAEGDFHLRKWVSNSTTTAAALGGKTEAEVADLAHGSPAQTILGVKWDTAGDKLTFSVAATEDVTYTRRGLLSKLAGVFDPLGLASPFIIKAKILTQQLCLKGLNWDDAIPTSDLLKWKSWLAKLSDLATIAVPRCIQPCSEDVRTTELHTFCDASVEAFAAAVYLRSVYEDKVVCALVMAKTKVAPKKALSVARLELQAAVLGTRLTNYVKDALRISVDRCIYWTDSKCALGWIRSTAVWYKPFVAHRIGEIQTKSDPQSWKHVPGRLNVSDCATRSKLTTGDELIPKRWFQGPDFLYEDECQWPVEVPVEDLPSNEEIKPSMVFVSKAVNSTYADVNLERCSTLGKAQRIAAQINRLFAIGKKRPERTSFITVRELRLGLKSLVRQCQRESFLEEILSLEKSKSVGKSSKLLSFTPYLDEDKIIRVGGRLDRAKLPYEVKHPIILPQKHRLTELIIEYYHRLEIHGGVDHVLASIRQKFWIIRGRQEVKRMKGKCLQCKRERGRTNTQLLSELPIERVSPVQPAFYHTSVDYFGPLTVRLTRNTTVKRYGVLFACMTTRCVHLEVAESLSEPDFLQALHKMMARRGQPRTIYSDNGTNFVGAQSELKAMVVALNRNEELKDHVACIGEGITWKFQPPASPHWGGVHESLVKSVKKALYRTLAPLKGGTKRSNPTDLQLCALMVEVERFVNSRPITYVSSDPEDLEALTPYHFWLHRRSPVIPLGDYSRPNFQDRFRQTQHMANLVWQQWIKLYLPTLISRKKWQKEERNIKVNDVVLISEPSKIRGEWKLGRVVETYPGKG